MVRQHESYIESNRKISKNSLLPGLPLQAFSKKTQTNKFSPAQLQFHSNTSLISSNNKVLHPLISSGGVQTVFIETTFPPYAFSDPPVTLHLWVTSIMLNCCSKYNNTVVFIKVQLRNFRSPRTRPPRRDKSCY